MKSKINISTKDLILSLLHDKMNLIKINDEKDELIYDLQNKLKKYEGDFNNAG